jgi:cytochrome P450
MPDSAKPYDVPDHVPRHLVRDWNFPVAPGAQQDPFKAISVLHDGPDIFWAPTVRNDHPAWVVTRHDLIREVLQDPATFSSKAIAGFSRLLGESWDLIPLEKDPPDHARYRTLMNPLFSPSRVAKIEESVTDTAAALIEKIRAKGEAEFITEFARPFPVTVFLSLMGLPLELTSQFLSWEDGLLHGKTMQDRITAAGAIKQYLQEMIAKRRAAPTDDLISFAVTSEVEGRKLDDEEVLGICYLLFVGGLDTVAALLGFTFKHLAENAESQALLRREPELIPNAIEEFLRAHAPVITARFVTRDTEFHGVSMKAGECISLCTGLAGRDEREFPDPHKIDFRRENQRHITFSAGPHRCIGSHLARREFKIALDLFLSRIPPFRVKTGQTPITHATGVFGVDYLPIVWD